jgi:hypothetical protein
MIRAHAAAGKNTSAVMAPSLKKQVLSVTPGSGMTLRGMTPRQAVNDAIGELLNSLLLDIETRNSTQEDALLRVDVA